MGILYYALLHSIFIRNATSSVSVYVG